MLLRQFITLVFLLLCIFKNKKNKQKCFEKEKLLLLLFTGFPSQHSCQCVGEIPAGGRGIMRIGVGA